METVQGLWAHPVDTLNQTVANVAHRVPYGYGDKAVNMASAYYIDYQNASDHKAAVQAYNLRLAQLAVARGDAISVYPDWCDHGSRFFAGVCEQFLDAPIWSSVLVLDVIALWLIFCMLYRQRQQNTEDRHARQAVPKQLRVKRAWSNLKAAVQLSAYNATLEAASRGAGCSGDKSARWKKAFEEVAKARDHRKKYQWKKDYDLMAVMGRGMGPVVMCICCTLISYEVHAWFTLVLPSFGLPPRLHLLVALVSAVVPFRIFLDYFRTSFTDPGSPQAVSRGAPGTVEMQQMAEGDIELACRDEVKKCHKCQGPKPRRAHHCKICRKCVLKMDHHCPFVNNCVGLRNHRFFILFLLELVIGCSILVALMVPQLLGALRSYPGQTLAHRVHVITVFAVALIADSMLAPFFYFHMQLVIVNETTLENMKTRSQKMDHIMKTKQLEFARRKAEKADDSAKMAEIDKQMADASAKETARCQAEAEEAARYSQGSFMSNYTEVFGAPPAAVQKQVEAVLEWFNPSPVKRSPSAYKMRTV